MNVPFKVRGIPKYVFDGDGRFPKNKITGKDKRLLRKRQIRKLLKPESNQ